MIKTIVGCIACRVGLHRFDRKSSWQMLGWRSGHDGQVRNKVEAVSTSCSRCLQQGPEIFIAASKTAADRYAKVLRAHKRSGRYLERIERRFLHDYQTKSLVIKPQNT